MTFSRILIVLIFCANNLYSQNIQTKIDKIQSDFKIPGIGVAIMNSDSLLYLKVQGNKINSTDKLNNEQIWDLGSNTQAFTAWLLAFQAEKNLINWDSSIYYYLPELKKDIPEEFEDITIKDVLNHRAFLQPMETLEDFKKANLKENNVINQRKEFSTWILKQKPLKWKKRGYAYSNGSYILATSILEKVTNKSFEDNLSTTLKIKYTLNFNKDIPTYLNPVFGISTSLPEYSTWIHNHLKGLSSKNVDLKTETYKYIHESQTQYALGWANYKKGNKLISYHVGNTGLTYCHTVISPKDDLAFVIVSNSADDLTIKGILNLIDNIFKEYSKKNND